MCRDFKLFDIPAQQRLSLRMHPIAARAELKAQVLDLDWPSNA